MERQNAPSEWEEGPGVESHISSEDSTVLYSGQADHYSHAVGILLSKYTSQALVGWKPVTDRIITARFHTRHAKITIMQVYVPTETAMEEEKDQLCYQLQDI